MTSGQAPPALSGAYEPLDPVACQMSWLQLNTADLEASEDFCGALFLWSPGPSDNDRSTYRRFCIGAGEQRIPYAGMMLIDRRSGSEVPVLWQVNFHVDDPAANAALVEGLGGVVVVSPIEITGGVFPVVLDPAGSLFGIDNMRHVAVN